MMWKKVIKFSIVFFSLLLLFFVIKGEHKEDLVLYADTEQKLHLYIENGDVEILPWEQNEVTYFFLPAYVKEEEEVFAEDIHEIWIDGERITAENIPLVTDKKYEIRLGNDNLDMSKTIMFMKSENLDTLFLYLDSGDASAIHSDKDIEESGELLVMNEMAQVENWETVHAVSCRGNSSFEADKKSYVIELKGTHSICGMPERKKWLLLANAYDGTNMKNKLAFDMANALEMPYTPESQWVDLYLDGEYRGNYLLCENIEVGQNSVDIYDLDKENDRLNDGEFEQFEEDMQKGFLLPNNPEDISGGYLLEKDSNYFYEEEESGFLTEDNNAFTIHEPKKPSKSEVEYIHSYIQKIEDGIENEDEDVLAVVDMDSFTKRYLVDELTKNDDTGKASMYFYKDRGDDMLYAGPVWDYDGGFGRSDIWNDWNGSVLWDDENRTGGSEILDWFEKLLVFGEYQEQLVKNYTHYKPELESILETQIDTYVAYIEDSVNMDMTRWDYDEFEAGHYEDFDDNVRFLKYFYRARLDFFNEIFALPMETYEIETTGETHVVRYIYMDDENGVLEKQIEVKDGELLREDEIPVTEDIIWSYERNGEEFIPWLPVYEDITIIGNHT